MLVFVKNSRGVALSIEVLPTDKVSVLRNEVRAEIAREDSVMRDDVIERFRLIFKGREIEDNKTIQDYAITECSIIQLQT
ncbi:hypothetical protein AB6A40_009131 [Gnathostoma spinigerum]|uniref:Ubiquitin-like domain-containing protein n=1 Tax=Gnathostoma spinigerum TaxID=75299 RepID=A0ABD6ETG6_9BILA